MTKEIRNNSSAPNFLHFQLVCVGMGACISTGSCVLFIVVVAQI